MLRFLVLALADAVVATDDDLLSPTGFACQGCIAAGIGCRGCFAPGDASARRFSSSRFALSARDASLWFSHVLSNDSSLSYLEWGSGVARPF